MYTAITFHIAAALSCGSSNPVTTDDCYFGAVDTLQVIFQIGEELGDSTNTFISIADVDIDENGRLLVLDDIAASVKAYDSQGNYLQLVTQRGSGPGELTHPRGLTSMPGGRLVVSAPSRHGFVVFDDSLRYLEEISLWLCNSPYDLTAISGNRMAICRYDEDGTNDFIRHTLGIYSWGEESMDVLLWKDSLEINASDETRDPSQSWIFCLFELLQTNSDSSGNIYFAPIDQSEYRVIAWDATGNEILNISKEIIPVEKSPEEIESEILYMNSYYRNRSGHAPPFEFHPNPFRNAVADVGVGPDGNLWVRRGTTTDIFFDIYDLDGVPVRHAVFPVESWSWKTETTPYGIIAWELDPIAGYQILYFLR